MCGLEGETRGARDLLAPRPCPFTPGPGLRWHWEQSQLVWGWQAVTWLQGPGAWPGQQVLLEHICIPTSLEGWPGIPLSRAPPCLLPSSAGPGGGRPALCPCGPWSLCSLFVVSLPPPPAALSLSACAHGLCCFPSPQGSLPADTLSPWSSLLLPASVFFFPPAPLSLSPPGLCLAPPYLCLHWPGLRVPVSPGAHAWVEIGVSLEKNLSASLLQLQAGCHGNRVRGHPLQQLSCGLGRSGDQWASLCPGSPSACGEPEPQRWPHTAGLWFPDSNPSLRRRCRHQ